MIRKIGLTGGIASGKSQVAGMLAPLLNSVHIDADETCRQLLEPEAEGWQELAVLFGSKYFTEDGSINRPVLRKDLFTDKELRRTINSVIHPLVKKEIITQMDQVMAFDRTSKVLVEVPLLYEVGWESLFDRVVVVYADYETCLDRLMDRDGTDKITAAKEMESQLPLAEKVIKADYVIDNSGVLSDTRKQVKHLADLLNSNSEPRPA